VGQLLRNRRLGCRRLDRITVRRYDANCREARATCGRGRRSVCDADRHSFRRRVAFISTSTGSVAIDHRRRSSLGPHGLRRSSVRGDRSLRMRAQTVYQPELEDWLFHVVLPLAAYAMLALSAFEAPYHTRAALFGVGAAALLLLFIGIHNAWDGVAYHVFGSNRDTKH
jgi:hypothetical protein